MPGRKLNTSETSLKIREFNPRDFERILEIDMSCFDPDVAYSEDDFRFLLYNRRERCLVAEYEGKVAGFVIFSLLSPALGEIITIDIDHRFRRKGIASRLLAVSETIMKQKRVKRIRLQVDTANEGAFAFYKKAGYKRARLLKGYYSNNRDAYLMVKECRS